MTGETDKARQGDILIVDDRSEDGTAELARELAGADERIHLMERPGRLGLGTAYRDGFLWVLARGYDIVVQMDADHSHDPADVPRLIDGLDGADVCCGSRYVPGGRCEGWPGFVLPCAVLPRKRMSAGSATMINRTMSCSMASYRVSRRYQASRRPRWSRASSCRSGCSSSGNSP